MTEDIKKDITLSLNGRDYQLTVDPRWTLADVIREHCNQTGTHIGCEHGVCGACSIRVDGAVVRGCLMLAVQADGADVVTVEGLTETGEIADLQKNFVERNAMQCGYCTPGMLITAAELLFDPKSMSREKIRRHLSGNFCRCTGYHAIVDAVETTINKRLGED